MTSLALIFRSLHQSVVRSSRWAIGLVAILLLTGLAGCAGLPAERGSQSANMQEGPLKLETHASLPLFSGEDTDVLQGRVSAGIVDERLTYSARYALEQGKLLATLAEGETSDQALPAEIGQQTLQQQVRLDLSDDDRVPLQLGLETRRDMRFLIEGEHIVETTRAHLDFNPRAVAVRLDWRLPDELATAPLGCHFNGNLRMPLAAKMIGAHSVVDFTHSECLVRAPDRGLDESALQSRGVAWRWGNELNSALRYRQVVPLASLQSPYPTGSAHEVGLSHREEFRHWGVQLEIARREGRVWDPVLGDQVEAHWVADLLLTGKLGMFDVSTRFMQAGDPIWFMPIATPADSRRFSLLLDFGAWLKQELPGLKANMSASFDRTEQSNGSDDSQVNWNVSLTW